MAASVNTFDDVWGRILKPEAGGQGIIPAFGATPNTYKDIWGRDVIAPEPVANLPQPAPNPNMSNTFEDVWARILKPSAGGQGIIPSFGPTTGQSPYTTTQPAQQAPNPQPNPQTEPVANVPQPTFTPSAPEPSPNIQMPVAQTNSTTTSAMPTGSGTPGGQGQVVQGQLNADLSVSNPRRRVANAMIVRR